MTPSHDQVQNLCALVSIVHIADFSFCLNPEDLQGSSNRYLKKKTTTRNEQTTLIHVKAYVKMGYMKSLANSSRSSSEVYI